MTRPDPASDLVGALRYIMDRLDSLEEVQGERRINAKAAAQALGFSPGYLYGSPWRIPTFGFQGYLYSLNDWRKWLARPEVQRRAEWDAMSLTERRKARVAS